jgi:hypothetical protein
MRPAGQKLDQRLEQFASSWNWISASPTSLQHLVKLFGQTDCIQRCLVIKGGAALVQTCQWNPPALT